MDSPTQPGHVEIRCFGELRELFERNGWPFPLEVDLERACPALDLAREIGLPLERIEAVFINHKASPISEGWVKPGDRVAFVPVGTPGPYRVLLGLTHPGHDAV